jgi:putative MATE family efflux protein
VDARRGDAARPRPPAEPFEDLEAQPDLPSAALDAVATPEPEIPAGGEYDAWGEIMTLSWPVMLSQVLLSAVGLIDLAMVGRLGPDALAAVGYATQFFHLSQSVLFAVGFACVALMARAIGAGDTTRARHALAASLSVATVSALLLTAVMLAAPAALLSALGAAPEVTALGVPYLVLVVGSSVLLGVSMVFEFAMRADRDTRTPMLIATAVTILKIVLNALLIFGMLGFPRLELVGAGLATVLSQLLGLALFDAAVARARHDSPLRVRARDFRESRALVPEVVRLALPSVGERLANNLALLAYFRVLSGYGTLAIAAYTVGVRLLSFSWIPGVGFGTAAATLVGQALGARQEQAAVRSGWRATALAVAVAVGLGGLCALMPERLARLFTSDAALVAELVPFLLFLALAQPALQAHFALGGAHRGAGDTMTPFVAATVGNWAIRVPLACLFAWGLGASVLWVWAIIVLDHSVRSAWLAWSFRRGRWRERLAD